jgi:hypothetical protein
MVNLYGMRILVAGYWMWDPLPTQNSIAKNFQKKSFQLSTGSLFSGDWENLD